MMALQKLCIKILNLFCMAALFFNCGRLRESLGIACADYDFGVPIGMIVPGHPPEICLTNARVELGRQLFYDRNLSGGKTHSCATCHRQELAFSDGLQHAIGSNGQEHPRNTQSLTNVGYFSSLTWNLPDLHRFDNQALIPLFSEDTASTIEEMAIAGKETIVIERMQENLRRRTLFAEAFPARNIDVTTMVRALAAFQTTLLSYRSAYDNGTMSISAKRGEKIFHASQTACSSCHGGFNFNMDAGNIKSGFYNIGLYNVHGKGDYPDHALHGHVAKKSTQGVFLTTARPEDRGKFRTPSLRNVALTAPYMHDGSIPDLRQVIEHFNQGGRHIKSGPLRGDGRLNPNKDVRIRVLGLSAEAKDDLVEFLNALSDDCFLRDPRYADPENTLPDLPAHCF